jgi:NAD(P)H dehydrogenase (quinone)
MILVTGASGKTGKALVRQLALNGADVRAWVHHAGQAAGLKQSGAADVVYGDIQQVHLMQSAMRGVDAVYHICSNMNPDEIDIGKNLLTIAQQQGVRLFGYHSVFHPHIQSMPHHWNKLQVEQAIFGSGMNFVILQPTAYMQNLLAYWPKIMTDGVFTQPYAPQTRLSLVDLEDVAEAACKVLLEPAYIGGTYELVGTPSLSQLEVAELFSQKLNKPVRVESISAAAWEKNARASGMDEYSVTTLLKMFAYYEAYGMWGSSKTMESILNRSASSLDRFVNRILAGTENS